MVKQTYELEKCIPHQKWCGVKPLIGITADMDKGELKLKRDYVHAVVDAGGIPFIIGGTGFQPVWVTGKMPVAPQDACPTEDTATIAETIDGIVLSGGGDIMPEYYGETISVPIETLKFVEKERIDFEIELFREVMKRQKPILAICYGMQLVNVALGGNLYQDIGIQLKDAMNHKMGQHGIKIDRSFCFKFHIPQSAFPNPQFVNSFHHQAVKDPGKGLEVFAISEDGIIEGLYKPGSAGCKQGKNYPFLVCVQWHPERDLGNVKGQEMESYKKLSSSIFRSFVEVSRGQKTRI